MSAASSFVTSPKIESRGEQVYSVRKGGLMKSHPVPHTADDGAPRDIVGAPLMHKSAMVQVTGEAIYTDDIALPKGALHAALVTSTIAHARVVSVDTSIAATCTGFVAYIDHTDVVGCNDIGAPVQDEEVFCTGEVKYYGAVNKSDINYI